MGEKPTEADEAKVNMQDMHLGLGRQMEEVSEPPAETGPIRLDPTPARAPGGGTDPPPAEGTTVKSSKSNSQDQPGFSPKRHSCSSP